MCLNTSNPFIKFLRLAIRTFILAFSKPFSLINNLEHTQRSLAVCQFKQVRTFLLINLKKFSYVTQTKVQIKETNSTWLILMKSPFSVKVNMVGLRQF